MMGEMPSHPQTEQLRHSKAMASGEYMTEMRGVQNPANLRRSDMIAPYLNSERKWGIPMPSVGPLLDNVLISPAYSAQDRTWGFPKRNQIRQSEVHVRPEFLDPIFIAEDHHAVSDEHVKTLLFETKKHLPDWQPEEKEDVTAVLSRMEQDKADFQPPETKEKVTTLFYESQVHLPSSEKNTKVDFDDMAPGPEFL